MDRETVIEMIKQTICEVLHAKQSEINWDIHGNFVESLSFDSILLVNFLLALERHPQINLDVHNLTYEQLESIDALAQHIMSTIKTG
jgi:acyl carrier protein